MTPAAIDPSVLADVNDDVFASMMQKVRALHDTLPPEEQAAVSALVYAGQPRGTTAQGAGAATPAYEIDTETLFRVAPPPPPPSVEQELPDDAIARAMDKLADLQATLPAPEQAALGLLAYLPRKGADVQGYFWWMWQPQPTRIQPVQFGGWVLPTGGSNLIGKGGAG